MIYFVVFIHFIHHTLTFDNMTNTFTNMTNTFDNMINTFDNMINTFDNTNTCNNQYHSHSIYSNSDISLADILSAR